jgi:hypothetical protein
MVSTRTADSKSVRYLLNTKTNILGKLVTTYVLCLRRCSMLDFFCFFFFTTSYAPL